MAFTAKDFEDTNKWTAKDFEDKPTPNKNALPYKAALKPKETAKPITPFPHRSDLKSNVATKQPAPKVDSLSYLKPIEQTLKGNTIDLKLPTPKKTGYIIGGLTVGDGKGGGIQDKRPITILSDDGKNVTVENQDGFKQIVPKQYLSTTPITPDKEKILLRNAQEISKRQYEQSLADSYKGMNPIDAFGTKATDIGFRQIENTPSLGGPQIPNKIPLIGGATVPDIAANIIGGLMGLATPTGGGNSLGGAMNTAGDIVESGVQKYGGNIINKTPKVIQKLAPKMIREVGEGTVYSASKAPEYTAQDWATNALQDATIGTALGSVVDGAKKLPEALENAKVNRLDNQKSKLIDAVMKEYENGILPGQSIPSTRSTNTLKPFQPEPRVKPTTLNKTLSLKNKGEETAYKRLEDGIIKAQDYFGTNELRVGEIEQFKNDTGIDLNTLATDYAIQSSKTKQQVFEEITSKSKYKRISGLGNGSTYKTLETVAKQGEKKPTLNIDKQTYEVNSLVNNSKLKPVSSSLVNNQNIKPVSTPAKYNIEIETKIKAAKDNEAVGTLGDYLQGEKVRELYNDVLDTPIKVTDKKNMVNGALGEVNGKPLIIVNKNTPNIEDTILEEASHAMREAKGRTNLSLDGINQAKVGQYETLPFEKSAGKMVEHAKTLDNIEGESGQFKKLKLEQSVKNSNQFSKEVKGKVGGDYQVKGNDQLVKDAEKLIKSDLEYAKQMAKSEKVNSDMSNEVARQLIQKAQKEGKWDEAIELVEATSKKAMESGRAVQALSLWGRMTPEGMLKYAQSVIDRANGKLAKANPKEFEKIKAEFKKKGEDIKYYSLNPRQSKLSKVIQLTSADAKHINDQMVKINQMADGRPKDVEVAKTLDYIAAKIPPSLLQQVSTFQTMAQLLNAKTALRNTLGNFGFQVLENLSDTLGTGMDKFIGAFTKERTKFLPSLKTQALGMKKGFNLGLEDALKGIDTSGISTQMDLPHRTFRTGFFGGLEKVMNIELRATDRAFYQSAFDQSLRNQMKAKSISYKNVTNEMIEQAHLDGLYKTFQDKNVLSTVFSKIKNGLNAGKEFGFGDLVMKYPKTPANLLMRGIDYSPLGIAKETFNLAKKGFDQKRFVESLSRAAVGTGLLGAGVLLYNLGILQGKKASDKEAYALMEETGIKQYTVNLSALKRFAMSGMNPEYAKIQDGDMMVNYDWIQPAALPVTAGTNIAQQKKDKNNVTAGDLLGATIYSLSAGVDTLAEQPLVQNFAKLFRGYDIKESGANVLKDIPASFVPTFVNQVRQMADNTARDSYEDGAYGFKEALNRVMYKIPGLSSKLPERVTTTGNTKQTYQNGSNNAFNVFLNPAFVTKYKSSEGIQTILDLYEETGETKQFPRQVSKTMTINGEKYSLSKDEINALQKEIGQNVMEQVDKMPRNAPNEVLIDRIVKILDIEGKRAKGKFKSNLHQSSTK